MNQLGVALSKVDKFEEAEALHRRAYESLGRVLGEEHPETMMAMNNLALALERQGKHGFAETLYRRSWEPNRRILGPDHPNTQLPMNNLQRVLNSLGKLAEQRPLVIERLARLERLASHPNAGAAVLHAYALELVTCQPEDLRDPAAALPIARRAVELDGSRDANILETLAVDSAAPVISPRILT